MKQGAGGPPGGILRCDSADQRRGMSIRWDEDTIAEHDKERGTRQKIDEPNTPYHRFQSNELDDPESLTLPEQGASNCHVQPPAVDADDLRHRLEALNNGASSSEDERRLKPRRSVSITSPDEAEVLHRYASREEELSKRREFEKKRMCHYDEFRMIQERRKRKLEASDDDVSSGEDEGSE